MIRKYNPVIGTRRNYEEFVAAMINAAENEKLPVVLENEDPLDITMEDINDFVFDLRQDTGLTATFETYFCEECCKLHMALMVSIPDDLETQIQ